MIVNLLIWVVFGALAGWIAGKLMGSSTGFIASVILGIIGSVVGGFVAGLLGISYNEGFSLASLIVAVAGACLIIVLARLVRK